MFITSLVETSWKKNRQTSRRQNLWRFHIIVSRFSQWTRSSPNLLLVKVAYNPDQDSYQSILLTICYFQCNWQTSIVKWSMLQLHSKKGQLSNRLSEKLLRKMQVKESWRILCHWKRPLSYNYSDITLLFQMAHLWKYTYFLNQNKRSLVFTLKWQWRTYIDNFCCYCDFTLWKKFIWFHEFVQIFILIIEFNLHIIKKVLQYFCNNLQHLLHEWLSTYHHQICTSLRYLQEKHHILLILEHYKVGFPFQGLDSEIKVNKLNWKSELLNIYIYIYTHT